MIGDARARPDERDGFRCRVRRSLRQIDLQRQQRRSAVDVAGDLHDVRAGGLESTLYADRIALEQVRDEGRRYMQGLQATPVDLDVSQDGGLEPALCRGRRR